ncbi:cephalotocin receptor 1-like [Pecten maximus]|uniref:cephalotocin receptor 1-like n=1 Tax=Pecten maximus TaxID=6579 RepID=UPI001458235A|nr:cephalotocin receptor 1-like [Pecten maximus]
MSGFIQTNDSFINTSHRLTLQEVNDIYASNRIVGVVFMCLFIFLGTIGNSHVIYIYALTFPKSNHRLHILCLTVLNWTICTVSMPLTVVDQINPLMADNLIPLCEIRRFLNYSLFCAAGFIMLIIACDRYFKICRPLHVQLSYKRAKYLCLIAILISCLFTWPAAVLFGNKTFSTKYGVDGVVCFAVESYKHYLLYFNVALVILFSIVGCTGIIFYVKIGQKMFSSQTKSTRGLTGSIAIQTHKEPETLPETNEETKIGEANISVVVNDDVESLSTAQNVGTDVPKRSKWNELRKTINNKITICHGDAALVQHTRGIIHNSQTMNAKRNTIMFLIISVIYLASYLPFLVFASIMHYKYDFVDGFSITPLSLYYIFLWCFFINNMINSIIYALCDRRYRKHLRQMYSACLPFKRK